MFVYMYYAFKNVNNECYNYNFGNTTFAAFDYFIGLHTQDEAHKELINM